MDPSERQKTMAVLRKGAWFNGLDRELQEAVVDRSETVSYNKGELILQQGAPPRGMFAVLEGQVAVTRRVDADREVLIHIAEAGLWFGELALLAQTRTVVAVSAHTDARIRWLRLEAFERLVAENPRRYRDFALLALERYAIFLRLTADVQGLAPKERLRSRLTEIAELHALESGEALAPEISVTHSELAEMIGVSRQTMNELLHQLEADGLIEVEFKKVRILDLVRLRHQPRRRRAADMA